MLPTEEQTEELILQEQLAEIVRMMIRMAHAMKLQVICEGVETVEHLRFLQKHDCDFVQGYLFSRPKDPEEITKMIIGEAAGTFDIMDVH